MKRTKIAPALQTLAAAQWNFMDTPESAGLVGGEYAKAESEAWGAATCELRALLDLAHAVDDERIFSAEDRTDPSLLPEWKRVARALARLARVSEPTP